MPVEWSLSLLRVRRNQLCRIGSVRSSRDDRSRGFVHQDLRSNHAMRFRSIDTQANTITLNLRDLNGDVTIDHQGLAHFSGQNQHNHPSLLKIVLFQRVQSDVVSAESTSRRDQVRKSDLTLNNHFYIEMQKIQELVSTPNRINDAND